MTALDAAPTLFVPVFRDKALLVRNPDPRALFVPGGEASSLIDRANEIVWLGRVGERDCFALDISALEQPLSHPALGAGELSDLMFAASLLPAEETEILAYARGILNWHRRHGFCPSCGKPTKPREGGHMRFCESEELKHFPRTDPAVMVLVTRGDRCVLARQPGWPRGFYAAIAGFVEPGESVEDAALREVKEELGLDVGGLSYLRSQPWPFPASLMLGYTAEADSDVLKLDGEELEDARWFTRDDLRNPQGFSYPPAYSLAHSLIQRFLSMP
jgi:NAD+ diphosphatase